MRLIFESVSPRFKHHHNEPYQYWCQDGGRHMMSIVTHATTRCRELQLHTFCHQGQLLQFRNKKSMQSCYNVRWHLAKFTYITIYFALASNTNVPYMYVYNYFALLLLLMNNHLVFNCSFYWPNKEILSLFYKLHGVLQGLVLWLWLWCD